MEVRGGTEAVRIKQNGASNGCMEKKEIAGVGHLRGFLLLARETGVARGEPRNVKFIVTLKRNLKAKNPA